MRIDAEIKSLHQKGRRPKRALNTAIASSIVFHFLFVGTATYLYTLVQAQPPELDIVEVELIEEQRPQPQPQPQQQAQPQPQQQQREILDQATKYAENPKADTQEQVAEEQEDQSTIVAEISPEALAKAEVEKKKSEAIATSNTPAQGDEIGGRLGALIRYQLAPCWSEFQYSYAGVQDIEQLNIFIEAELYRNGTLKAQPVVFATEGVTVRNEVVADVVARNAAESIARCAPYKFPQEIYDRWSHLKLRFILNRWR